MQTVPVFNTQHFVCFCLIVIALMLGYGAVQQGYHNWQFEQHAVAADGRVVDASTPEQVVIDYPLDGRNYEYRHTPGDWEGLMQEGDHVALLVIMPTHKDVASIAPSPQVKLAGFKKLYLDAAGSLLFAILLGYSAWQVYVRQTNNAGADN